MYVDVDIYVDVIFVFIVFHSFLCVYVHVYMCFHVDIFWLHVIWLHLSPGNTNRDYRCFQNVTVDTHV